jgi:hypothetical protein
MLNAWAFVWLCGLKVFWKNLKDFMSKRLKRKERKRKKQNPNPIPSFSPT